METCIKKTIVNFLILNQHITTDLSPSDFNDCLGTQTGKTFNDTPVDIDLFIHLLMILCLKLIKCQFINC